MTFVDFAWVICLLTLGFFVGFWRGQSKQGRKTIDYWLTAQDGRVNWSRATAAVGLSIFVVLTVVFVHVYEEKNGKDMTEELLVMILAALGLAGINLGQYVVSKKFPTTGAAPAASPGE